MTTVALPKITDELWEEFNDTCLMTCRGGEPEWTQTAVDFACSLDLIEESIKLDKD